MADHKQDEQNFIVGNIEARLDYTLGYVNEFLELHKAPQKIRASFALYIADYIALRDALSSSKEEAKLIQGEEANEGKPN